jgi:hypothetical protein
VRSGRPSSASAGDGRPAGRSRRRAFRRGGIRHCEAPTADPQSVPKTVPQSPSLRSRGCRPVCALHASGPVDPCRDRLQTVNIVAPSSSVDTAEVSPALLVHGADEAWSQGTEPARHRRCRRHETAESDVGVSTDRATVRLSFCHSHHEGCGAAHPRRSVPADIKARLDWPILADGPRSRERQSVEYRPVSMRIGHPAHALGARRVGPLHPSHRGLWRAPGRRGWRSTMPDVQSSDSRPTLAQVPQLGS